MPASSIMDCTNSNPPDPRYLHVPFSKRWDCHRNTIQRLYIDEGLSVEDIASKMKDEYSFDASGRQYKYHMKKWGMNKNISSTAKDQVIKALEKRERKGKATGIVRYKGEAVDKKKLTRHMKSLAQLRSWGCPRHAFNAAQGVPNHPSPAGTDGSTPSAISILSPPQMQSGPSPSAAQSPFNAPTPTTMAIRRKTMDNRAASLLGGRYGEFLGGMSAAELRISTAWLDQFWYFAFKTFKHWGKGPRVWTPDMLQFSDLLNIAASPNTPGAIAGINDHTSRMDIRFSDGDCRAEPTDLCRWSIHVSSEAFRYDGIPSPPQEPSDHYDINDPGGWPSWPEESSNADPVAHIQSALQTNTFSNIETEQLPLSFPQVAEAAAQSPDELLVESVGFAIMARNDDLLYDLLNQNESSETFNLGKLYPYHLAASYLDGAKSCCTIMRTLTIQTTAQNRISNLYINNSGHTVLDSLMMNILKAHTSCLPETVDQEFRGLRQFVGAEVDPCGRWDADAPCIRNSNASSPDLIPQSWKHMFCHTSVQAVCHSITDIFEAAGAPDIATPSGLFVKSCGHCGDRLQPLPLHTLVLTTFHLAQNGCEGETLFGALACLALIGADDGERCTHQGLNPLQLARYVPQDISMTWTKEVQLGWDVFLAVLQLAQQDVYEDEEYADEDINENSGPSLDPGRCEHDKIISVGALWASIQTEFLTYRRLKEGDPWISENFSMISIIEDLRDGRNFTSLPLIDRKMMKSYCECGIFDESFIDEFCPLPNSEEVCTSRGKMLCHRK
ncbi:hypothetical protein PG987_010231 [Apiospora arundinis]